MSIRAIQSWLRKHAVELGAIAAIVAILGVFVWPIGLLLQLFGSDVPVVVINPPKRPTTANDVLEVLQRANSDSKRDAIFHTYRNTELEATLVKRRNPAIISGGQSVAGGETRFGPIHQFEDDHGNIIVASFIKAHDKAAENPFLTGQAVIKGRFSNYSLAGKSVTLKQCELIEPRVP